MSFLPWSLPALAATYHVAPSGTDTRPCAQVTASTPRQTLNGGIACLAGGDTLEIASGTYTELLVAGVTNLAPVRTLQPNTANIPNGLSPTQHTTLRAAPSATVWVQSTLGFPGGGGVITATPSAQYITWDGINADGLDVQVRTVMLEGSDLLYTRAEVTRSFGQCITSQQNSHRVTLSYLHVHHCGLESPPDESPNPHALYICGTGKIIEYNHVHHAPNRGIQLSCEQGGIADGIIRFNRIHDVNIGIGLQGRNNATHDNIIVGAGIGIWMTGGSGGIIRNNTIYDWRQVLGDTYGILAGGSGGPVLRDNIIVKQRVITSTGFNRYIHTTGSIPQMSGNLFDILPRGGIQPAFVVPEVATLFVDAPAGDFRLAPGSPAMGVGHNGSNLGATLPDPGTPDVPAPVTLTVTPN